MDEDCGFSSLMCLLGLVALIYVTSLLNESYLPDALLCLLFVLTFLFYSYLSLDYFSSLSSMLDY